jgi:rare lipoprotein A
MAAARRTSRPSPVATARPAARQGSRLAVVLPLLAALALGGLSGCAARGPKRGARQEGIASWYGGKYHGRRTASGAIFDEEGLTAAHRHLPFGTRVKVTNLSNGRSVVLVITDRGPFVKGRVLDVSRRAARELGFLAEGLARVRIEVRD